MKPGTSLWLLAVPALGLTACSRDYAPAPHTDAETLFTEACANCHPLAHNGSRLQLSPEHATTAFIQNKIRRGSLFMPAFPRLDQAQLDRLSHYVLEHAEILR